MSIQTKIYTEIFKNSFEIPMKIVYWNGEVLNLGESEPEIIFKLNEPLDIKSVYQDASIALAEAYMDKKIEIDGSIKDLMIDAFKHESSFMENSKFKILSKSQNLFSKDNAENIQFHYDIGNDFYEYWLDDSMNYSCAYFKEKSDSLEEAQKNKINHCLKKLRLREGEELFDIGCGWGNLIMTAAKEFGVKATGCTLSKEQYLFVQEKIKEERLEDRVDIILMDYSEAVNQNLKFDKIVSIGMLEHVGKANIHTYFNCVNNLLKDDGLALIHSISGQRDIDDETKGYNGFLNKYIFPGGYIPSIAEIVIPINKEKMHIIDLESLRYHYKLTLDEWYRRFSNSLDKIKLNYDERFIRMWSLYLLGCSAIFEAGKLDVCQYLIEKGTDNNRPLTRSYML
ncbi:MAG: cyclopropane-fatty-acyl-phospholipid synthase family protein [Tissierellia bacterium]|nr:cyclopropane-fatty-acyl-phospholipid synthase family protein [Tissierellia bacterium]